MNARTVPSLYASLQDERSNPMDNAVSPKSKSRAASGNGLSIELRRNSADTFVSANEESGQEGTNFADGQSRFRQSKAIDSTFDVGRWTVRERNSTTSLSSPFTPARRSLHAAGTAAPRSRRTSMAVSRDASLAYARDEQDPDALFRVGSEPVRGGTTLTAPFSDPRLRYDVDDQGFVQLESISGMRDAVQQIGAVLERRRKSGVKAARSKDRDFWIAFAAIAINGFLSATDMTIIVRTRFSLATFTV